MRRTGVDVEAEVVDEEEQRRLPGSFGVLPTWRELESPFPNSTTTTFGFAHIYVISLSNRRDRLLRVKAILDYFRADYEVFEGESHLSLRSRKLRKLILRPYDERHYAGEAFAPTGNGQISCYLSHMYVAEDMVAKRYKNALILEDDVDFLPDFASQVAALFLSLLESEPDWELLYLGYCGEYGTPKSMKLLRQRGQACTHGYALTRTGAKKVLEAVHPVPHRAIDMVMIQLVESRILKSVTVVPMLIMQAPRLGQPLADAINGFRDLERSVGTRFDLNGRVSADGIVSSFHGKRGCRLCDESCDPLTAKPGGVSG